MSIDKSLKRRGGKTQVRCVLTRAERVLKMMADGTWTEGRSPYGLPKTRVQKVVLKKRSKKEEAAATATAGTAASAGTAAKSTPPAKK
ncbi:MAG: small basic protein [Gemmataceae bacterium]|nr:small basic protein [Gemmataceae bacterium]MCS7271117.1 small basic protein [Gemmataceae bacterium]MDW8241818.1 small basic protein [Thermogemmata sp.]